MSFSRRTLLGAIGGAAACTAGTALGLWPTFAAGEPPAVEQPFIQPRDAWAQGLAPVGWLEAEAPQDVRFLLIHHSATPNDETPETIPGRIQSFFNYHTGTKGWPDVAYNFFVDPFGGIWEGRQGSLSAPIKGDATGGSQGFALLCCFIGDFTELAPTPAAMDAMVALLAWLAGRHGIDLSADAQAHFISRGSTLWPVGTEVFTDPIAGHRDMSQTTCPGEALYPLVRSELAPRARALLAADTPTVTPTPSPSQSPSPVQRAESTLGSPVPSATAARPTPQPETTAGGRPGWVLPAAGVGAVGAAAGLAAVISRGRSGSSGQKSTTV